MYKGIDVSSFQPSTLAYFQSAKKLGYDFAVVKLTENTNYTNPSALTQINNAKSAGMLVHTYHFARFLGGNSTSEANYFVDSLRAHNVNPNSVAFLDYEVASSSQANNTNAIINFLKIVRNAGYRVGFYSYYGMSGSWNIDSIKAAFPNLVFWLANYGVSQPGLNGVDVWQYADNGVIAGSNTDLNYDFNGVLAKNVSQAPVVDNSKLVAKITYNKASINLLNSKGKYVNHYLKPNTNWLVNGVKTINYEVMLQVATDMYLPLKYTNLQVITISYIKGYGVNAVNSDGKQIIGSNTTFKDGTKWRVVNIKKINNKWAFLVGKDEYIYKDYVL